MKKVPQGTFFICRFDFHCDHDERIVAKWMHEISENQINQAVNAVLGDADVKERFVRQGAKPAGGAPQVFSALVKFDTTKWKKIIAERKISAE